MIHQLYIHQVRCSGYADIACNPRTCACVCAYACHLYASLFIFILSHLFLPTADVQALINFGHDRGVRVIPEFDVPGHAAGMAQWNETLAACPQVSTSFVSCGAGFCFFHACIMNV